MKYRQKPNGMWVVDYLDDQGIRRRVSTGIKTPAQRTPPAEAKAAAREIVLGVRTPQVSGSSPTQKARQGDGRMTVSELLDKCEGTIWHPDNVRSQRTIRSNVRILRGLVGDEAMEDITYTRLTQLVSTMKERGYKPATIKRKLAMLARALKEATMWTDEKGLPLLRSKPPFPRIVVNNLKDRIITPVEQEALFAAIEKRRQTEPNRQWFRFRVFLTVVFATGGRLSEVLGLSPKHITQNGGTSYLTFPRYRTKSGKPRTLPLMPDAVTALGSLMDHLVLDKETQEWRFFGLTPSTMDVMFKQAREDVELETGMDLSGVTIHTIRHTVLTRLAQGGMDLARLQEWAGHSDPKITAERYLHLMPSDLNRGLAILGTGGTNDAAQAPYPTKPVSVPNTLAGTKGASPGTARLQ
jgi:integrase